MSAACALLVLLVAGTDRAPRLRADAYYHFSLGLQARFGGRPDEALQELRKAQTLDPTAAAPRAEAAKLLRETGKNPWPLPGSSEVRAHEFHYSSLENLAPGTIYAYDVMRGNGVDGQHDGIVHKNLLACYAHLRDLEDNHWTRRFVQFVRQQRRTNGKHQVAR